MKSSGTCGDNRLIAVAARTASAGAIFTVAGEASAMEGGVAELLADHDDAALARLMTNLGGHCLETLTQAFDAATGDQPTLFIAYTVKGWRLPFQGHKDNHSGLMTKDQMEGFRTSNHIRDGHEWDKYEGLDATPEELAAPVRADWRVQLEASVQQLKGAQLTARELDVGRLMLSGCSSKEIARKLEISVETVKVHKKHMYSKLGIKSQSELFSIFLQAQNA
mgnify:CR=1 FL=1